MVASALAFMQGLYPPVEGIFATNNGGLGASVMANRSLVQFPLNGYQYPSVLTMDLTDPSYIW